MKNKKSFFKTTNYYKIKKYLIGIKPLEYVLILFLINCIYSTNELRAWTNHSWISYLVFSENQNINKFGKIPVETLSSFLHSEAKGIENLLVLEEIWAKENIKHYPKSNKLSSLVQAGSDLELLSNFISAIRINPSTILYPYVQSPPNNCLEGINDEIKTNKELLWHDVTLLKKSTHLSYSKYFDIGNNSYNKEKTIFINPLAVLSTATDEPDYGMDIGLWENNNTSVSKEYGFGKQPFGNPLLEFSSQAPFHMGFFHERSIVYYTASFLERTYPEYRIHLFQSLATYAFKTNHTYWGLRFAGFGLHYLQDLTQPYHSRVLPSHNVFYMLWINLLDILGFPNKKKSAIQLLTNRHLAIEDFVFGVFNSNDYSEEKQYIYKILKEGKTYDRNKLYDHSMIRNVLTKQSSDSADQFDEDIRKFLPKNIVENPNYIFGEHKDDILIFDNIKKGEPKNIAPLVNTVIPHLKRLAVISEQYLDRILFDSSYVKHLQ